ncbi:hypothetical protein LMG28138_02664 [Pararobbsia alpina]|uniref:Uncharacterized protein n=1 Tax=Pararobbsia alpina TaxID=621374 RepID=A0A6S7CUZ8_9BURK|nr:hypothetical protein LMG28138_02664 [Pararobbsia alpina]
MCELPHIGDRWPGIVPGHCSQVPDLYEKHEGAQFQGNPSERAAPRGFQAVRGAYPHSYPQDLWIAGIRLKNPGFKADISKISPGI